MIIFYLFIFNFLQFHKTIENEDLQSIIAIK